MPSLTRDEALARADLLTVSLMEVELDRIWMWAVSFFGAATSFIESTLGQIYKEKDPDTGEYRGGPAYYFEKAYAHKARTLSLVYAIVFAVVTVFAMSFFLPGVQANGMSSALNSAWGIPTWATAIGIVIALAFIVIRDLVDTRIRTERDVKAVTSAPLLADAVREVEDSQHSAFLEKS